jgi:hypothetical protein
MPKSKRVVSAVLLACGIVLVFTGLSAALGFTLPGILASVAAIAALLYAGAVWFGEAPGVPAPAGSETLIVFDRSLRVAAGGAAGVSVLAQFPEPLRPDIEVRCRAALRGEHSHFDSDHAGARLSFDIAPVQIHGVVLYGVLMSGSLVPVAHMAAASLPADASGTTLV